MATDPQMTLNRLSGLDQRIVEQLHYLVNVRCSHSSSKARYAFPSQSWLAERLGVSRETVCRRISRMSSLGILRVIHRRKVQGHFRSNLYIIVRFVQWGVQRVLHTLRRVAHRVTERSHIAPPQRETFITDSGPRPSEDERGRLTALISDLADRFKPK